MFLHPLRSLAAGCASPQTHLQLSAVLHQVIWGWPCFLLPGGVQHSKYCVCPSHFRWWCFISSDQFFCGRSESRLPFLIYHWARICGRYFIGSHCETNWQTATGWRAGLNRRDFWWRWWRGPFVKPTQWVKSFLVDVLHLWRGMAGSSAKSRSSSWLVMVHWMLWCLSALLANDGREKLSACTQM